MDKVTKSLLVSIGINILITIIKIAAGLLGNSKALLSDGIQSVSNLATDFFAIIGNKLSLKHPNKEHPKGFKKIANITSLGIGIVIMFVGISLLKSSFEIKQTIPSLWVILAVFSAIVLNWYLSNYLIKQGHKINSDILISSGLESRADIYSAIIILFVVIFSQFYKSFPLLKYLDSIGSFIISILILYIGIKLVIEEIIKLIKN